LVVCLDDYRDSSFASDVAAIAADEGFKFLKAPVKRVARAIILIGQKIKAGLEITLP